MSILLDLHYETMIENLYLSDTADVFWHELCMSKDERDYLFDQPKSKYKDYRKEYLGNS